MYKEQEMPTDWGIGIEVQEKKKKSTHKGEDKAFEMKTKQNEDQVHYWVWL